jgi:MFS family permease
LIDARRVHPRRALAIGVVHVVGGVLPPFLAAAMAPRIGADFAFDESALGIAVAISYATSAVASSPAGHLTERLGADRSMRVSAALTVACCLGAALLADSALALIALLVVGGLGNALCVPAASALLDHHVQRTRRGVAFGAMQAGAPLAALAAGLALPVVAIPLGWRWAYAATAALALAAVVAAPRTPHAPARRADGGRRRDVRSVHALAGTAFLASAAGNGLVSFIVVYGVTSGLSESQAGLLLGGISLMAATARVVLGLISDRSGGDPLRPVAPMMLVAAGGFGLLLVDAPAALVAGALLAGGVGWAWPGALTAAVVLRAPEAPAWAVGVLMSGLFGGAIAGPLAVGMLADRGHYTAAWLVLAVFALLAAATVALVRRSATRTAARSSAG